MTAVVDEAGVVEALDQLQEVHDHARYLHRTVREMEHLSSHRQDRTALTPRWADVAIARRADHAASDALTGAGSALERVEGAAVAAYLLGALAAAAAVQVGRIPRRDEVLAPDVDVPLARIRGLIAAIDPARIVDVDDAGYFTHKVAEILTAIDAVLVHDDEDRDSGGPVAGEDSLGELRGPGYPGADELVDELAEFAVTVHVRLTITV